MFTLTPFSTQEPDVFDYFNAFDRYLHTSQAPEYVQCKTDIYESGNNYILSAELPGFQKEDINIELKDDVLTITASHSANVSSDSKTNSTDKGDSSDDQPATVNYIRRERRTCNYKRSFKVDGIDSDNIKANYTNGILELTLPKIMPKEPEHIKIDLA